MAHGALVGSIDQGTSSTRFLVFSSKTAEVLTYHQVEVKQFFPQEGWVEQDPNEFIAATKECIEKSVENLKNLGIDPKEIVSVGITNQRETTIIWDKTTGQPLYNAVVWLDTRTTSTVQQVLDKTPGRNQDFLKEKCGLPISTYFSALKIKWIVDNVPEVQKAVEEKRALFGTVDTWILWNMTGGVNGGVHVTDVTNASRTMLMNISTCDWSAELCKFFNIPVEILPQVRSSSEVYGKISAGALKDVPIAGILGDQQSALVGQSCIDRGQVKNTYGTGCFMLYNTGTDIVQSKHGLLTTVAFKLGDQPPVYALEGSVAIAGAVVRWLRDNLTMIAEAKDVEPLARSVPTTGGVYFVPAFSGLYAPYWQMDARGVICGLTQHTTKAHIARAALEAVCFQAKEVIDAMYKDCGVRVPKLRVDGGMTKNGLMMQLQADILGVPVERPSMPETTALGAAMAAGAAMGAWSWRETPPTTCEIFSPAIGEEERARRCARWSRAVQRSMGWLADDSDGEDSAPTI